MSPERHQFRLLLSPDTESGGDPGGAEEQRPDTSDTYARQFIWTEDLSENAQRLYVQILGDTCTSDYLQFLDAEHGIDVQTGLAELERYDQVDYSNPHIIRIRWIVESGI